MSFLLMLSAFAAAVAQEPGKLCAPCHVEQLELMNTHRHPQRGVVCEMCHGASVPHRTSVGATAPDQVAAPDEVPELCGDCHSRQHQEYAASKHGKLVLARSKTRSAHCGSCHGVHDSKRAAQMKRQCDRCHTALPDACSRKVEVVANRLVCGACHAPHSLARR